MTVAALSLALIAAPVRAQVKGVTQSCGCYCGKMIPAPCTEAQCVAACGGGAPSSSGGSGGLTPSQQAGLGAMQLGAGMIQQGLRDAEANRRRKLLLQEQERLRRLDAERRLEEELDRRFQEKKRELIRLGAGGMSAEGLRLKDAYEEEPETARDAEWCKLNRIRLRRPTRPVQDLGGQYRDMLERYRLNKREWERRCGPSNAADVSAEEVAEEDGRLAEERRRTECDRWLARREAAGQERVPAVRRRGLERPADMGSELYGQLAPSEVDGLRAQALRLGTSVFVCGSYAETDLGLSRRYLVHQVPECRSRVELPEWRHGPGGSKLVSDLVDNGAGDCDVMTLSPHVPPQRAIESVCGAVFPRATRPDAGYQRHYPSREALAGSGCLEFAPGAATPIRHRGSWQ